jgi:hypothetical protein
MILEAACGGLVKQELFRLSWGKDCSVTLKEELSGLLWESMTVHILSLTTHNERTFYEEQRLGCRQCKVSKQK